MCIATNRKCHVGKIHRISLKIWNSPQNYTIKIKASIYNKLIPLNF